MSKRRKKGLVTKYVVTCIIIIVLIGGNYWGIFSNPTSHDSIIQEENKNTSKKGIEIPLEIGKTEKGQTITHKGFTLSYNTKTRTPNWVAWELTKEETRGDAERSTEFLPDPKVTGTQVETYDYSHSGYDRGHMAPAGDMKWNIQAMKESFYMSNICPQDRNLNQGIWNDLEMKTREWARRYGKAYIVCGPIYEEGKQPKRIGKNKVAVPHAFFKAILIYKKDVPMALGFYFENKAGQQRLQNYLVSIDELEELADMDFFSLLSDEIEDKIEKTAVKDLP